MQIPVPHFPICHLLGRAGLKLHAYIGLAKPHNILEHSSPQTPIQL